VNKSFKEKDSKLTSFLREKRVVVTDMIAAPKMFFTTLRQFAAAPNCEHLS
jgi:hypothetical protein